jgi:hypothetical protein
MDRLTTLVQRFFPRAGRRPRRGLAPAVRPLEGRRLLSGGSPASATMTQTVTFPDLESQPDLSSQLLLYFSPTMGTLTEVDVVTSGSFTSQFSAENAASTGQTVQATTSANLSINVPTGAVPVVIPPVTQSVNVSGLGVQLMPTVTSTSTPQTTALTSPADLAAFTGYFDIPISVTGHATGSVTPNDGNVSASFNTDTSATITVIYHYIPDLPAPGPSPGASTPSSNGGGSTTTNTTTGTVPGTSHIQAVSAGSNSSSHHAKVHPAAKTHKPAPHRHPHPFHHHKAKPAAHSRHHGPA